MQTPDRNQLQHLALAWHIQSVAAQEARYARLKKIEESDAKLAAQLQGEWQETERRLHVVPSQKVTKEVVSRPSTARRPLDEQADQPGAHSIRASRCPAGARGSEEAARLAT